MCSTLLQIPQVAAAVGGAPSDRRKCSNGALPAATLEPGCWECHTDGGEWVQYEWPYCSLLEQAFCQHKDCVEFATRGNQYKVQFLSAEGDLHRAVQVNTKTGKRRDVRRWPSRPHKALSERQRRAQQAAAAEVAWSPWLGLDWAWVLLDAPGASSQRPGALGGFGQLAFSQAAPAPAASPPPDGGLPMPQAPPAARATYSLGAPRTDEAWWPELLRCWPAEGLARAEHPMGRRCNFALHRVIKPRQGCDGREWAALSDIWAGAGLASKSSLVGAYRVQNRGQLHAFAAVRHSMLARLSGEDFADGVCRGGQLSARLLWHGTRSVDGLLDICSDGFDRARAATCAYGKGCYFASTAAYSDKYACGVRVPGEPPERRLRAVLLAAVLVGEQVQGHSNMYPAPVKPHSSTGERFENAVDKLANPSIFVTFKDSQAVPVYVMIYEMTQ